MRIVFVRHGEPDYKNDCLTEIGRKQAVQAAERLLSEGIEEIYSSPLGRAYETAEAASKVLGLPIRTLGFMREVRWGSMDGTPIWAGGHPWECADEMARRGMDLTRADWRETEFFKNNSVLNDVDNVARGIDGWLKELGYERNGTLYTHTRAEENHRTIVLFSHGGSSCAAMGHILNMTFPYACALLHLEYTGITVIRFDRREGRIPMPCLELANDGKHIKEGQYHRLKNM